MHGKRKLQGVPALTQYRVNRMKKAMNFVHIQDVTRPPQSGELCYYLPHHCANSKKPRLVFGASCRITTGLPAECHTVARGEPAT